MKKILDFIIVILAGTCLFAASSVFRFFHINSVALLGPSLLYFLTGISLRVYYDKQRIVSLFFATTILWSVGVLLLPGSPNIQIILITGFLIMTNLSLGYFFNSFSKMAKYFVCISMVSLISYLALSYMPKDTAQKRMTVYSNLIGKSFTEFISNTVLKDTTDNRVKYEFKKDSIYLLEFFFKSCAPCKMKEKILPRIAQEFKNLPFKIIYIDNAEIDDFQSFTEGARGKMYAENFYDEKNILIQNLKVQSFPLEVIIDKKGVIRHTYSGYSFDDDNEYFKITTNKIKDLLNE